MERSVVVDRSVEQVPAEVSTLMSTMDAANSERMLSSSPCNADTRRNGAIRHKQLITL